MTDYVNEFGHGIICPFIRDGKGDFAHGTGRALLRSDIAELIGIIGPTATTPGELPWNTEIGSRVLLMKHRRMHVEMIRATADQMAAGVVRRWEKRARPGPTEVVVDYNRQEMRLRFSYIPLGRSTAQGVESVEFTVPQGT